jgi:hypothetical protein
MAFSNRPAALLLAGGLLATAACNGNGAVPPAQSSAVNSALRTVNDGANFVSPEDDTSILKKLTKDVVIGTTVDPTNGDKGPRAVSVVGANYVLKKGQVLVCNFENKSGTAGDGTTVDVFDPTPGSKPTTFTQYSKIEGCDGDAITTENDVYASALTSGDVVGFTQSGKFKKLYTSPLKAPLSDVDVACPTADGSKCLYSSEYIFSSDAQTGGIVTFGVNEYANPHPVEVANGFGVNKKSGWSALGPSGLAYDYESGGVKDTLYIADGVDNTIVAFDHASELLAADEIVVQPGGKTFKCKYPSTTCGRLVKAGSPLNAPEAMTLLPNGNLIVANTAGGNTLVELTPSGKVLDTKVVDTSKTAGVFGLAAIGTSDSNTALFFTDTNSNNLQELEQ